MEMDSSRRRRLLLMTLGVVLAVVAGGAAFLLGQGRPAPAEEVPMVSVLVAARDIAARSTLTADDVVVRQVPESAVLPQARREVTPVIGLVNSVPIYAGQQITPNLFTSTNPEQDWEILPADEEITLDSPYWRAVSVSIPRTRAVGGEVFAGQRVDLFVSVRFEGSVQVPRTDPETGETSFQPSDQPIPIIDPETGEIIGLTQGVSTKITFEDVEVLKANPTEGLYIFKVDLHQAEQIAHILQEAPDSFGIALRPPQDTRDVDGTQYGETTDTIIMEYVYRVPLLLNLEDLLGFPITPVGPDFSPPPPPLPAPEEPGESPAPEESPEP